MIRIVALVLGGLATLGCSPTQPPADAPPAGSQSATPSAASARAGGAGSASPLPSIDDACTTAADCTIYMPMRADEPCCPGCTTYKGANKSSLDQFRSACAGRYAMCAGSCAAPPTHAECMAGHCAAVVDK